MASRRIPDPARSAAVPSGMNAPSKPVGLTEQASVLDRGGEIGKRLALDEQHLVDQVVT